MTELLLSYTLKGVKSISNFIDGIRANFKYRFVSEEGNIIEIEHAGARARVWLTFSLDESLNLVLKATVKAPEQMLLQITAALGKPTKVRRRAPSLSELATLVNSLEFGSFDELVEIIVEKTGQTRDFVEKLLNEILRFGGVSKIPDEIRRARERIIRVMRERDEGWRNQWTDHGLSA